MRSADGKRNATPQGFPRQKEVPARTTGDMMRWIPVVVPMMAFLLLTGTYLFCGSIL